MIVFGIITFLKFSFYMVIKLLYILYILKSIFYIFAYFFKVYNFLHRPCWPRTHSDPLVLELKACTIIPLLFLNSFYKQGSFKIEFYLLTLLAKCSVRFLLVHNQLLLYAHLAKIQSDVVGFYFTRESIL